MGDQLPCAHDRHDQEQEPEEQAAKRGADPLPPVTPDAFEGGDRGDHAQRRQREPERHRRVGRGRVHHAGAVAEGGDDQDRHREQRESLRPHR